MSISIDDPRLSAPQCHSLQPVETIHRNNWFALRSRGGYFTIEYHHYQVVVLPIVDDKSVVMVSAKRPVMADSTLELPAGASFSNETTEQTAARELEEETGIKIDNHERFVLMQSIAISPNRYPILPWIYKINLTKQEFDGRGSHDDEVDNVDCLSFASVIEMIVSGEIYVSLPIAIISRYLFSLIENPFDLTR